MSKITIPFKPREYQWPLINVLDEKKRAFCLWHRRAGKDLVLWNYTIKRACLKSALYYYLLPTYTQAKKIIWDGITNDGIRFLDFIPREIRDGDPNSTEMKIKLVNGSIIQLIGTDKYDSIRGTNPYGCVFSEFAYQNPQAWEVVKPILKVNGGWAVFNTTPNGRNHSYDLDLIAQESDDWFHEKLTILDTGVLAEADMKAERKDGMSEEMIQQEYFCSYDVGLQGSIYAKQMLEAMESNRICAVPYEKLYKVKTWLDLGRSDSTTIAMVQIVGKEVRIIDSYEHHGEDVAHYVQYLRSLEYEYGTMYLPHDAFAKRMESRKTIAEQFKDAGFEVARVPRATIDNGIAEVRKVFPNIWFDKEKTVPMRRSIENYHKEWDDKKKIFKPTPLHDWSSHFADTLRYICICQTEIVPDDYEQAATTYAQTNNGTFKSHPELGVAKKDFDEYERQIRSKYLTNT